MNAMPFFISIYVKELFILSITPPPLQKNMIIRKKKCLKEFLSFLLLFVLIVKCFRLELMLSMMCNVSDNTNAAMSDAVVTVYGTWSLLYWCCFDLGFKIFNLILCVHVQIPLQKEWISDLHLTMRSKTRTFINKIIIIFLRSSDVNQAFLSYCSKNMF